MFGSRKKRGVSLVHQKPATTNPNAQTAAASAFMSRASQPSNSLSSAAAAAALRARPQTPTNVGEVQTKRTVRRAASNASISSTASAPHHGANGRPNGGLHRRGSSSSMTERTFRSPSPGGNGTRRSSEQHPPVPKIPESHKRSTSLGVGMQTFKTASQKMNEEEYPSWYRKPQGDPSNVRTSDAAMNSPSQGQVPERSDSRNSSTNFSYPKRLRSPTPEGTPSRSQRQQDRPASRSASIRSSDTKEEQKLVYDPNSRRMVPQYDLPSTEQKVRDAAERKPSTKKKTKGDGLGRAGSHLSRGTVARVKGTAVDDQGQEQELPKREQPVVEAKPTAQEAQRLEEPNVKAIITPPKQKETQREESQVRELDPQETGEQSSSEPARDDSLSPRPAQGLVRKPSIVPEESEPEEEDNFVQALESVPTKQTVFQTPASPPEQPKGIAPENKSIADLSRGDIGNTQRSVSNSPARQAHFARGHAADSLTVRHSPPARSASPIKSALKQRAASPSDEASDASAAISRDQSPNSAGVARKKSVRVSFDDQNTQVVGESAPSVDLNSPVAPSPQQTKVKRPWFSNIVRNKHKDAQPLDDDEVMKPRPALPVFGSVREKKNRESEERALVTPHEPLLAAHPSVQLNGQSPEQVEQGVSNDHAIGTILAQDQSSRNAANISKFREPLPPVVTSIEGNGYISESSDSPGVDDLPASSTVSTVLEDSDDEMIPSTQATHITEPDVEDFAESKGPNETFQSQPEQGNSLPRPASIQTQQEQPKRDIPAISVITPSPGPSSVTSATMSAQEPKVEEREYFGVPGGFPEDDSDDHYQGAYTEVHDFATQQSVPATETDAVADVFEPPATVAPIQTESLPQTTLATTPTAHSLDALEYGQDETDDHESIYSDAYEDLSDIEGDGFMSLDAVVESPISAARPKGIAEFPAEVPTPTKSSVTPQQDSAIFTGNPPPGTESDEWETAKAYWKSLTAEKRRQLESEATEEAGDEADRDDIQKLVKRVGSKKKSAEQRAQERQTIADSKTRAATHNSADPERTYMIQPGTKAWHEGSPTPSAGMRKSMRGNQPVESRQTQSRTTMRGSLRGESAPQKEQQPGEARLRKSMRPSSSSRAEAATPTMGLPTPRAQKDASRIQRPASLPASGIPTQTKPKNRGSVKSPTPSQIAPSLHRRGSDASDSSFKRSRATQRPESAFNFRSTMRGAPGPATAQQPSSPENTRGSGRFSLRSLSPSGSTYRRSSTIGSGAPSSRMMATRTLRSGSESSHASHEKRSSHIFGGFKRSSGAKTSQNSKRGSRFGDSSDEDEPVSTYRSRFADSSDEDEPRPSSSQLKGGLARGTMRGSQTAPKMRRATPVPEEESEELPDSDDEKLPPHPAVTPPKVSSAAMHTRTKSESMDTPALHRSGSGRSQLAHAPTPPATVERPTHHRRGSLMSILRRKKTDPASAGKIQKSELIDSAARRDTKLERSPQQLSALRGGPGSPGASSPKLQKRRGLNREGSWPLPEELEQDQDDEAEEERPSTAGNILAGRPEKAATNGGDAARPAISSRRNTDLGVMGPDGGGVNLLPEGKKKKKFGALRRMFRLDD